MACHYPNLTPEQLATPVEPDLYFARRSFGVTTVVRVVQVIETGWCLVEGHHRYSYGDREMRGWLTTTHLRQHYHPMAGRSSTGGQDLDSKGRMP